MPLNMPVSAFTSWSFRLAPRVAQSPLRSGALQVAELGPASWILAATTRPLNRAEMRAWKAHLARMRGGALTFWARDPAYDFVLMETGVDAPDAVGALAISFEEPPVNGTPITAYEYRIAVNGGFWSAPVPVLPAPRTATAALLAGVNAGARTVTLITPLEDDREGYVVPTGAMLSYDTAGLGHHLVIATSDATVTGRSVTIPVEPTPVTPAATPNLRLVEPRCEMAIIADTVEVDEAPNGTGSIRFEATQVTR